MNIINSREFEATAEERTLRRVEARSPSTKFKQDLPDFMDQHGPLAPKNSNEAAAFIKAQQGTAPKWHKMCLSLQRQARGLPAVAPSALSAALMTPESERIHNISDLRRGMVGYCDDPNDTNPFGHIFYVAGRDDDGEILTWTNDAKGPGSITIVPFSFYRSSWGDSFQFGATWLNGFDFSDFNKPPKQEKDYNFLGAGYENVIEEIKKIRKEKRNKGADEVADALSRDIDRMLKRHQKWQLDKKS